MPLRVSVADTILLLPEIGLFVSSAKRLRSGEPRLLSLATHALGCSQRVSETIVSLVLRVDGCLSKWQPKIRWSLRDFWLCTILVGISAVVLGHIFSCNIKVTFVVVVVILDS